MPPFYRAVSPTSTPVAWSRLGNVGDRSPLFWHLSIWLLSFILFLILCVCLSLCLSLSLSLALSRCVTADVKLFAMQPKFSTQALVDEVLPHVECLGLVSSGLM